MTRKKYNILFVATYDNYFVKSHSSFSRMYNNLNFFYNHKNFNVIVLQGKRDRDNENKLLKKDIKTYYFREIKIMRYKLLFLVDLNPFFILKAMKIIKKHRIDLIHVEFPYGINCLRLLGNLKVSYNAHNVELIYFNQVGKYYFKLPRIFRSLYSKFIYFLEKNAIKFVKSVNAISNHDRKQFIEIYNTPKEKLFVNPLGYNKEIYENQLSKIKARNKLKIDKNKFVVIFHGFYFANYANREAINIIKDYIAPQINDNTILFLIAGNMPPFKNTENLRFLGFLDNLNDFLYSADIAIVPIQRGSGTKGKVIDYLSANIPIISTKKGAEGILIKNGLHGYIIKDPVDNIIEKIIFLKNNPDKIKEFKIKIKELINRYYIWETNLKKLAKRYELLIDS